MLYAILGLIVILVIVLIAFNVRTGSKETQAEESSAKAMRNETPVRNETQPTYFSEYKRPNTREKSAGHAGHSPQLKGIQSDDEYRKALRQFKAGQQTFEEHTDDHIDDQDYRDALRRMNRK
jgi:hypothetical protein